MTLHEQLNETRTRPFPFELECVGEQRVLVFDVRPDVVDPSRDWVVSGLVALAEWLKAKVPAGYRGPFSAILIENDEVPPHLRGYVEALGSALQAMVNSVAMEHPRTQLTTLRVDSRSLKLVDSTAEYLASDAGSYVTASTIDLRRAR